MWGYTVDLSEDGQKAAMEDSGEAGSPFEEPGYAGVEGSRRTALRGWLIVCAIAIAFVLYGFFAFHFIGDKGPPDWDAGAVQDVPGASLHSSAPFDEGSARPEPQHVSGRPSESEQMVK
jgi:hypothetical protein